LLNRIKQTAAAATLILGIAAPVFGQAADLAVTKSGPATGAANTDVTYTVTITNVGPDDAVGASLSDAIPAGMTFVSRNQNAGPLFGCADPGPGNGGTITCSIAAFPAGSSATFVFVLHIPVGAADGTTYNNTATATDETPPDPNPENNTSIATTVIPPPPQADVAVLKNGPGSAGPNTDVTYTITLSNPGPGNAGTFSMQDTLPGTMTFVSIAQSPPGVLNCVTPAAGAGGTITCSSASFAPGTSTITLVGHIPSGTAAGTAFDNSATITSTNDPNAENNTAFTSLTVSSTDVSIVKSGPASAIGGTNVTYTLTVSNAGPDVAVNVNLTDPLPAGSTLVSFLQNTGPAASCSAPPAGANGTVACNFISLAAASSATFTLVVKAGNSSPMNNTATVSTDSFDSNTANNSSTVSSTITLSADLAVVKTGPATVTAGTNATYTITLTNNGPSDASGVSLTDVIPANATFVSEAQTAGPAFNCTTPAVGAGGTVTCSIAAFPMGTTATFSLVLRATPSAPNGSSISNTATVSATSSDPNPGNNSSTATASVATSADVSVTKTGPAAVAAGGNISYTITVTNNGTSDAQAVSVTDAIPANTTFVSAAQNSGPAFTLSTPPAGGTGTFTASTAVLTAGASATFTLVVNVNSGAAVGTAITNTASVATATSDPNPANNSSSSTATVATGSADLSITKTTFAATVVPNTDVTFTIAVHNNGPDPAIGVTMTDTIPTSMTFVSANSTQGTCTGTGPVVCTIGTMSSGATVTVTVVAHTGSTAAGTSSNTATVTSGTPDPNPANNTATATVVAAIPTLSPLLLMLLAAVLGGVALLKLR
jgi:uncharacterized repeat protein (TIGR01451 family)